MRLPYYDAVRHVTIDGMHCPFLGVAKHVLSKLFEREILDGVQLQAYLNTLRVPRWIGKVVTSLVNKRKKKISVKRLKAAELKCFVTVYSDAVLTPLLPTQYLTMWKHFSAACQTLCRYQIALGDLPQVHKDIYEFLTQFETLFGFESCVPNMHFSRKLCLVFQTMDHFIPSGVLPLKE